MKTHIIYETVYGTTKQYAQWISERIEGSLICDISSSPCIKEADAVILGYPVYMDKIPEVTEAFIKENKTLLTQKKTGLFIVCLEPDMVFMNGRLRGSFEYIGRALDLLESPALHAAVLPGEINPLKLSEKHREAMFFFYKHILKQDVKEIPFQSGISKKDCWDFAAEFIRRTGGAM